LIEVFKSPENHLLKDQGNICILELKCC